MNTHKPYCILTFHLLTEYKMYPGMEFSWTVLTGID